jgi:hypothetical protein
MGGGFVAGGVDVDGGVCSGGGVCAKLIGAASRNAAAASTMARFMGGSLFPPEPERRNAAAPIGFPRETLPFSKLLARAPFPAPLDCA